MIMSQAVESPDVFVGDLSNTPYKIETNAKMIDILSSKIYTDKIMAPVRELLCNAWDAHIDAGTEDTPIDVTITDSNDEGTPTFTIRDYGTGLSESQMRDLYTTYGASTKTSSNDFTGCMGLGSKAPFAYTKEFRVTSFYQGRKYMFVCSLNRGMASITQFPSVPSDEPAGLLVSFDLETSDCYRFSSAVERFCRTFHGKVNATCRGYAVTTNRMDLTDADGYGVVVVPGGLSALTNTACSVIVVMSGVAYPYAFSKIAPKFIGELGLSAEVYQSLQSAVTRGGDGFIVLAEPGEIDFTASRELCEDTDKTSRFVIGKLYKYVSGILDTELSKLDADTTITPFERAVELAQFFRDHKFLPSKVRDNLLAQFSFSRPTPTTATTPGPTTAVKVKDPITVVTIANDRWRHDKRARTAETSLSPSLGRNIPYSCTYYGESLSQYLLNIQSGRIRFVAMDPDRSRSGTPPAICTLLKDRRGAECVIMLFYPADVEYLESIGVKVTKFEDLPKPERTYTARGGSGKDPGRDATTRALEQCFTIDTFSTIAPRQMHYLDCNYYSMGSKLTSETSELFQACRAALEAGDLVIMPSERANNCTYRLGASNIMAGYAALDRTRKGAGISSFPARLLASILVGAGKTVLAIPVDKHKHIERLLSDGAVMFSDAIKDFAGSVEPWTKSKVLKVCKAEAIKDSNAEELILNCPDKSLSAEVRTKLNRIRKLYNDPESRVPDTELPQFWIRVIRSIGLPGVSPVQVASTYVTDPAIKAVKGDIHDISKEVIALYPALDLISHATRWDSMVRSCEYHGFDVDMYVEAMDLYYKKHKNNRKGEDNE